MKRLVSKILGRRFSKGIETDISKLAVELGLAVDPLQSFQSQLTKRQPIAKSAIDHEFAKYDSFDIQERYLIVFPNARIVGKHGHMLLENQSFIFDQLTHHPPFLLNSNGYRKGWSRFVEEFWPGEYFSLVGVYSHEFYHWLGESLPQLHRVIDHLSSDTQFIVPEGISNAQQSLLTAIGITKSKCRNYSPKRIPRIERLFYSPPPTVARNFSSETIAWLSSKILSGFGIIAPQNPDRKILISRRNCHYRKLINEDEIFDTALKPNGFERVELEKLSIVEQIKLFSEAHTVVGPHGAGLIHLMFCKHARQTKVLELFPTEIGQRTHYWSLADACDQSYSYLKSTKVYENEGIEILPTSIEQLLNALSEPSMPSL